MERHCDGGDPDVGVLQCGHPHYIILIGVLAVGTFLSIEARRYRDYDVYRARVRLMQGNLLANTLNPETGVEHENWRTKLSEDYRQPTLKVTTFEALSNRLRRIYLPLLTVLVLAWVFRITAFIPPRSGLRRYRSLPSLDG